MTTQLTAPSPTTRLWANARHTPGTSWWVDLGTDDVAAAQAFYGELFGWSFAAQEMPQGGTYAMASRDGLQVAAISSHRPEMRGAPPLWNVYLTVRDVDAVTASARRLGATVLAEPFEVMDAGRMSVIADASGAAVSLWQARTHPGAAATSQPGTLCWAELITGPEPDVTEFWTTLMGWAPQVAGSPEQGVYTTFTTDDQPMVGMLQLPAAMAAEHRAAWMPYFAVADVEATAARVRELGGTVVVGPDVAQGVGRFVLAADAQGGHFYAIQLDQWPQPAGA